jgi:hypothetical protein
MDDEVAVDALRRVVDAELGTHLHGDHAPPDARVPVIAGSKSWDFNCCYAEDLERRKLESLTAQFRDRFDRNPLSYRAGRYSASGRTARILSRLGYVAETSVTPRIRWVHEFEPDCVLDFRAAPLDPYRPASDDLSRPGDVPIWEVPITILPAPSWWSTGVSAYQRLRSLPVREYPIWLRPSTTSWPWLHWIVNRRLYGPHQSPLTVFNIMFHSMEVIEGASPYSPDARSTRRILHRLDRLLRLLRDAGAQFVTLSQLAEHLSHRQSACFSSR